MKKFPRVYIEITNSCNFNCTFCGKSNRKIRFMDILEFKRVINEVKKVTNLVMLHVKGEPLLHPDLSLILDECEKAKVKVNITTNGSLLLKRVEDLKKMSVRQLNISIHSISQNKDNEFQKDLYLDNIFKAVRILKEYNPNLLISYRLWNLKNISENSENYEVLQKLSKEYEVLNLNTLAKENEFVELGLGIFLNQDIEFKWPSMDDKDFSDKGRCLGLKNQFGVLSDGTVIPCCLDQDGNIALGNIFNENIENILESSRAKNMLDGFLNGRIVEELCKKCTYRERF